MKTFDFRKELKIAKSLQNKIDKDIESLEEGDIIVMDDIDGVSRDLTFTGTDNATLFFKCGKESVYIQCYAIGRTL